MSKNNLLKRMITLSLASLCTINNGILSNAITSSHGINSDITTKTTIQSYGGTYIDEFYDVVELSDKSILAVGYSESTDANFINKGESDAILVKYDKDGTQLWNKSWGGSSEEKFYSVAELNNKDIVAVGYIYSNDAGFNLNDWNDAIIVKYDSEGNQLWTKSYGGSEIDVFQSVEATKDGGFICAGYSKSRDIPGFNNQGYDDGILVKYDSDGNIEWSASYGGTDGDAFYRVIEVNDGYLTIGFSYSDTPDFSNNGMCDGIVVKYNKSGVKQWAKSYGGSDREYFNGIVEAKDGGFIVVGEGVSTDCDYINKGDYDGIIIKYDKNGNQEWSTSYGGSEYDCFNDVVRAQDDGFVIIGQSASNGLSFQNKGEIDAVIVKYDKSGNLIWEKNWGGSYEEKFYSVINTYDDCFIAVGYSYSDDAGFEWKDWNDAVLIKYDFIINEVEDAVAKAEFTMLIEDIANARYLVNNLTESQKKSDYQSRLDNINNLNLSIERKTATTSLDIYIKSDNMLSLSLNTNSVTFDDYSGAEDMEKLGAVNISINSSLPYQLNAYMPSEITNTDKSETIPVDILNIRDESEGAYQTFANTTDKVVLKDNCAKGNDLVHSIDLKLSSNQAHKADVYKTVIKFEAEQK